MLFFSGKLNHQFNDTHYVNYGKAEGRVGTFISGDNPKTKAPIYGVSPIPKGTTFPATLLEPLPPKAPSKQAKWSEETTNFSAGPMPRWNTS